MGYEIGFENKETRVNYWYWCGWDFTQFHRAIAAECGNVSYAEIEYDKDFVIPVENLEFINVLFNKVSKNKVYRTYYNLLNVDGLLADEYIENLSLEDRILFAMNFVLPAQYTKYQEIAKMIYVRTLDDSYLLESLKKAYDRMVADGVQEVVLYGG